MEYAVKGETLEGATVVLCRGFASVEEAEDHRVKLALFKRVWVEQIETNEAAAPLTDPIHPLPSDPSLHFRPANISRKDGARQNEDYDVFDDDRFIGRLYLVDGLEWWFWGVQLTGRKSYGHATSLDKAKAAFKAEYEKRKRDG